MSVLWVPTRHWNSKHPAFPVSQAAFLLHWVKIIAVCVLLDFIAQYLEAQRVNCVTQDFIPKIQDWLTALRAHLDFSLTFQVILYVSCVLQDDFRMFLEK